MKSTWYRIDSESPGPSCVTRNKKLREKKWPREILGMSRARASHPQEFAQLFFFIAVFLSHVARRTKRNRDYSWSRYRKFYTELINKNLCSPPYGPLFPLLWYYGALIGHPYFYNPSFQLFHNALILNLRRRYHNAREKRFQFFFFFTR